MARGGINHLALTVTDLSRSASFYEKVLGFMGYTRVEVPEATQQLMRTRLLAFASPNGSLTLRPAKGESVAKLHDRNALGFNHLAFSAESKADVDGMYNLLKEIGAQILDPPADYAYFPVYHAIYFADPDGLKIEFVYWPTA
jgi:glyoxylase I family protein